MLLGVFLASLIFQFSTIGYYSGKCYKTSKDYYCCKGDQLYCYHYYDFKVYWVNATSGFTQEAVGNPISGGCNVQCNN